MNNTMDNTMDIFFTYKNTDYKVSSGTAQSPLKDFRTLLFTARKIKIQHDSEDEK